MYDNYANVNTIESELKQTNYFTRILHIKLVDDTRFDYLFEAYFSSRNPDSESIKSEMQETFDIYKPEISVEETNKGEVYLSIKLSGIRTSSD